jgi:hypothetical protein
VSCCPVDCHVALERMGLVQTHTPKEKIYQWLLRAALKVTA